MTRRALGPGSIRKTASGYVGTWSDAAGRRHRRVLSQDRGDAQRILAKTIRDRDLEIAGLGSETQQLRPLREIVDAYMSELELTRRPSHVRTTRIVLGKLVAHLGPIRIIDLRAERILEFRRLRLREGASNRTINMAVAALQAALRWAHRSGLIGANPIVGIKPLPTDESTQRRRRRALTEEEIVTFIAAAREIDERRSERFAGTRTIESGVLGRKFAARKRTPPVPQAPMWVALVSLGIRWGEAATLRWADIDEQQGFIRIRAENAKGKASRVVPVPATLLAEIVGLKRTHVRVTGRLPTANDHVFLRPRGGAWQTNANGQAGRLVREILKVAGILQVDAAGRQIDVHALRRSACTRLLRHRVPLNVVARILGHKDTRVTTKHYEDLANEDLTNAVAAVPEIKTSSQVIERRRTESANA